LVAKIHERIHHLQTGRRNGKRKGKKNDQISNVFGLATRATQKNEKKTCHHAICRSIGVHHSDGNILKEEEEGAKRRKESEKKKRNRRRKTNPSNRERERKKEEKKRKESKRTIGLLPTAD
jgi:hypothetical protein